MNLARVEQVTGVPDYVTAALGLVILLWAVIRSVKRGTDELIRRSGDGN